MIHSPQNGDELWMSNSNSHRSEVSLHFTIQLKNKGPKTTSKVISESIAKNQVSAYWRSSLKIGKVTLLIDDI